MLKKKPAPDTETLVLTHDEINLLRECMMRAENYYRGLLLLKSDWNPELHQQDIAIIKSKIRMIDQLQEKTLYDGQPEYYRKMQ